MTAETKPLSDPVRDGLDKLYDGALKTIDRLKGEPVRRAPLGRVQSENDQ